MTNLERFLEGWCADGCTCIICLCDNEERRGLLEMVQTLKETTELLTVIAGRRGVPEHDWKLAKAQLDRCEKRFAKFGEGE